MNSAEPTFYTLGPYPSINLGFTSVSTYFLTISFATCFCIYWFFNRCEKRELSVDDGKKIGLIILIMGFIGARLTHILFEAPEYYLSHPLEVFHFWQGGFVFYGAAIFSYIFSYLYIRKKELSFWLWHDTLAPVIALGYALGRISCFLVGCCYGKVCELPWAYTLKQVHIASSNVTFLSRHPTQLYASFFELLILVFLLFYERRKYQVGHVFLIWVILHSINRFVMELFRGDPRGPLILQMSLSMILSLFFFVTALTVYIYRSKNLKK